MKETQKFVFNLDQRGTLKNLCDTFSEYGRVVAVRNTGNGYGFITYATAEGKRRAIKEKDDRWVSGRKIRWEAMRGKARRR